jgi:hypothetical protein
MDGINEKNSLTVSDFDQESNATKCSHQCISRRGKQDRIAHSSPVEAILVHNVDGIPMCLITGYQAVQTHDPLYPKEVFFDRFRRISIVPGHIERSIRLLTYTAMTGEYTMHQVWNL